MKTIIELNPNSLWLEIPKKIQQQIWQESQVFMTEGDRRRAYINLLCQRAILPYLQEECPSAEIEENQAEFWQLGVNGTAFKLEEQRLIVIPSEAFDLEEFRIPQELIDIPELAADYYLAAQIDAEEEIIRIWGYTTHKKLKEKGNYSRRDRSYFLERKDVIEDLNSLWLIRQYFPDEPTRSSIESLPQLSLERLNQLFDSLSNPDIIFPRRVVYFEEWGALFAQQKWRLMLLDRRMKRPDWIQVKIDKSWDGNTFRDTCKDLKIPILPEQLEFPSELKDFKDRLVPFRAKRNIEKEERNDKQWSLRTLEINNVSAVLAIWLKLNTESYELLVQLYSSRKGIPLLEGIELSLWTPKVCIQKEPKENKLSKLIQTHVYTVKPREKITVIITCENNRFEQSLQNFLI